MARSSSLVLVLVLALVAVSFAQRHGPMRGAAHPYHPNGPARHPQMPGEHNHYQNQNYNNGPQHMRELVAMACASDRSAFCPDLPERLPAERFFEALCFRENVAFVSDECRALFERYQFVKNGHHARSSSSSSSDSSSGSSSDSESSSFSGNSADFPQEFLNNQNPLMQIDELQPIQIDEQQVLPSRRPGQGYHNNNNNNNHYNHNNHNNHNNHHNGNNRHHEQRSSPDWITLDLDTTDVALLATGVAVAGGIALVLVAIAVVLAMFVLRRCCRRRSKTATTTTTTTTSAVSAAQPQPAVMPQVYYLPVPMFPNDHQQQHAVQPHFASIPMQDMAQH